MRWREALQPVGMERVAVLAPSDGLRDLLVNVADEGTVALGEVPAENGTAATGPATARLRRLHVEATGPPSLATSLPDLDRCERAGRLDLIGGGPDRAEDRPGTGPRQRGRPRRLGAR